MHFAYSECCDISGQKMENSENGFWSTILKPLLQSLNFLQKFNSTEDCNIFAKFQNNLSTNKPFMEQIFCKRQNGSPRTAAAMSWLAVKKCATCQS